jgi:hypothetical protein
MNAQKDACRALLAAVRSQRVRGAVLFTDECTIYWSVHSQTIVFWAKEKPNFYKEPERNPLHIMMWAGLSAAHMFGPFIFHGFITGQAYHNMLSKWLVPQLQQAGIKDTVVLQLDGAPPHFALHLRDYLSKTFPELWIERGSEASPTWPLRSPNLTTTDNALWGFIKESQQNAVTHNRSVTGSCRRSLHSRDPGLSAQNICQSMAQNSTVLRQ